MDTPHLPRAVASPRRSHECGVVLIYAILGMMLVAAIVLAGGERNQAARELSETEFDAHGHARRAAESGLVDALAWLRRQYEQPVGTFAPRRDLNVDPPIDETDDPAQGLVREYEIARGYWGRYRVHPGTPSEPFTDRNGNGYYDRGEPFEDLDGDGRRTMARGCRDLSTLRGAFRPGIAWYLESEGSVYRRFDADVPLGEGRNRRLGHFVLGTEVRRLAYVLEASAAIVGGNPKDIQLQGAILESPTLGIAHRPAGGQSPSYITQLHKKEHCEFLSPIETLGIDGWLDPDARDLRIRCEDVFGVSMQTLRAMADYRVTLVSKIPKNRSLLDSYVFGDAATELPVTIPEDALVVVTPEGGTLKVDKNESIIGKGIVVIDGNMEVKEDSFTNFSGILFVSGNLKVERTGAFEGIVIVGKKIEIKGELPTVKYKKSARKKKSKKSWKSFKSKKSKKSVKVKPDRSVWFGHNPDLVASLVSRIGSYRKYKPDFPAVPLTEDGRPDEAVGRAGSLLIER